MVAKAVFSSGKNDWATPDEVFLPFDNEFLFTVDAAANATNARAPYYFTERDNALAIEDWGEGRGLQRVWVNPPYSRSLQARFIAKAAEQAAIGHTVVMLLPARTDTVAYHEFIWDRKRHQPREGVEVRFLKGRIKFVGAKHGAPFPSMVVIFRGR